MKSDLTQRASVFALAAALAAVTPAVATISSFTDWHVAASFATMQRVPIRMASHGIGGRPNFALHEPSR